MLLDKKVTSKYVQSLILVTAGTAAESKETLLRDLKSLSSALQDLKIDTQLIDSPICTPHIKSDFISCILDNSKCSVITGNLLTILVRNSRLSYLQDIVNRFGEYCLYSSNIEKISVVSAAPMAMQNQNKIKDFFCAALDKQVIVENTVDEAIMGGVIIKLKSYVCDNSVYGKLKQIRLCANTF